MRRSDEESDETRAGEPVLTLDETEPLELPSGTPAAHLAEAELATAGLIKRWMTAPGGESATGADVSSPLGQVAWAMYEWARNPYVLLITIYIFAPYFTTTVVGDPVRGQALWGDIASYAGFIIAVLAPFLGAIADAGGRRKPWIAAFSVLVVVGCTMLWWTAPGAPSAVAIALTGYVVATIGFEFATVFNNAMMPSLVPPEQLGRLSGTGWAVGYFGGLICLMLMLVFALANADTGMTLAGIKPILGLDPATGGGARASGPFSALWYVVLVLPMFLFVPDRPHLRPLGSAVGAGLAEVTHTLRALGSGGNISRYLLAHLIYADGLIALFAFGGIYAIGIFGWSVYQIGLFGILLTIAGTFGALIGGWLDDRLGAKTVVLGALIGLIATVIAILSISSDRILFVVAVAPPTAGHLFASPGEHLYLVLGALAGVLAGPVQSASRTLLVRLSPPDKVTEYFGLYALSSRLTAFVGPLTVGALTAWTASQRIGMSALVVIFIIGAALLAFVKVPKATLP